MLENAKQVGKVIIGGRGGAVFFKCITELFEKKASWDESRPILTGAGFVGELNESRGFSNQYGRKWGEVSELKIAILL